MPTPQETDRAWELLTAIVANDLLGPPRDEANDEKWEAMMNRALELSVLYTAVVAAFP